MSISVTIQHVFGLAAMYQEGKLSKFIPKRPEWRDRFRMQLLRAIVMMDDDSLDVLAEIITAGQKGGDGEG